MSSEGVTRNIQTIDQAKLNHFNDITKKVKLFTRSTYNQKMRSMRSLKLWKSE